MADMMRVKDAAKLWGITERRVIALCQKGKIKGAVKNGTDYYSAYLRSSVRRQLKRK